MSASDPFLVAGPAQINFSGGRTSGLMLRRILDAHDGVLPPDVHVLFANTGKEREETLEFVRDCGAHWGVVIHWVEMSTENPERGFIEVTFETAARNGEPFAALIRNRKYLPNPTQGFCTTKLKIHPMRDWMRSRGYFTIEKKRTVDTSLILIGLRADEQHRVARLRERNHDDARDIDFPLFTAGVTKRDVMAFWAEQPFDLRLQAWEGNCDLCFKKGQDKRRRIMREHPGTEAWWIEQEAVVAGLTAKPSGAFFRIDAPSYARLAEQVRTSPLLSILDDAEACAIDDLDDCLCTGAT